MPPGGLRNLEISGCGESSSEKTAEKLLLHRTKSTDRLE
jgi:hypothetical protein